MRAFTIGTLALLIFAFWACETEVFNPADESSNATSLERVNNVEEGADFINSVNTENFWTLLDTSFYPNFIPEDYFDPELELKEDGTVVLAAYTYQLLEDIEWALSFGLDKSKDCLTVVNNCDYQIAQMKDQLTKIAFETCEIAWGYVTCCDKNGENVYVVVKVDPGCAEDLEDLESQKTDER